MRKTDLLKTCRKGKFLRKKIWKNALALKGKMGNVYFGIIIFSCLLSTRPCIRFFLTCFTREIKGFYQSSLANEIDFRDIMNISQNILGKNQNFKNLTWFCRWKSTDDKDVNIFLSLENPCTFLLAKEKICKCIFNTNSELSQNRTEKKKLWYVIQNNNKLTI